jgi:hypothetical protein
MLEIFDFFIVALAPLCGELNIYKKKIVSASQLGTSET